jgi:tetratricopeptide (TPR) repeat protein
MQFQLKSLSRTAVPAALEKAHLYRLLNEPWQAESICEDVLRIDPHNQTALVALLLAMTDQFETQISIARTRDILSAITGEYERAYYEGIVLERAARARMQQGLPGACFKAYEEFLDAMHWYERAEAVRPPGNDDALLRWNTCARTLVSHPDLRPRPEESLEPVLDD